MGPTTDTPPVIHWWAQLQTQHQALTLSSIDKTLSQNRHRVWGPTRRCAIKEESKVANCDWVDHQACSLLQYISVITNVLIMRTYFNKLHRKILEPTIFSNLNSKSPYNSGSESPWHKRDLNPILNLDKKSKYLR